MVRSLRGYGVPALGLAAIVGGAVLLVTRRRSPYTGFGGRFGLTVGCVSSGIALGGAAPGLASKA